MDRSLSPLADRTNAEIDRVPETAIKSPVTFASQAVPPPPPPLPAEDKAAETEPPTAQPVPKATLTVSAEQSLLSPRILRAKLSALGEKLTQTDSHPHSHYAFAAGQLAFAFAAFSDVSLLNLSAWGGLVYLLCGGIASALGKTGKAGEAISVTDLEPALRRLVAVLNEAISFHRAVFLCAEPKKALKGAAALYALSLLSARLPAIALLWAAFTLAFALPQLLSHFEPQLAQAKAKAVEKAVEANALLEDKFPKKYAVPVATLLFATYSSYSTMALTLGVGCIGVQAWREANPLAEADFKELSSNADAAFDKIKKKARRLTISAKDMMCGKPVDEE